jgi:gas vesicle protein
MADSTYDRYETEGSGGFMMGLLAGTVLGAGLGMLLAPKSGADLRGQLGEQAKNISNKASEQYRRASETASQWAERGRDVMNQARDAVSRGAEEVRSYTGATTGSSYPSEGGYTGGSSYPSGTGPGSSGSTYGGGSSGTSGSDFGRS